VVVALCIVLSLTDIPRIPGGQARFCVSARRAATKFDHNRRHGRQIVGLPVSQRRNTLLGLDQGAPLPSSSVGSDPISRSCRRQRRPQPGDEMQDFLEHLPRHRDLSHLLVWTSSIPSFFLTLFQ
jgi:hypothetical protein